MKGSKTFLSILALMSLSTNVLADHAAIGFGTEVSGPINTIGSAPSSAGDVSVGVRTEYIKNNAFSDSTLESFANNGQAGVHSIDSIVSTSIGIAYGVSDKLSVSVRIPQIQRSNIREAELQSGVGEVHSHGDTAELGDITVLGMYNVHNLKHSNASLLVGVKLSTGTTNAVDANGELLETEFQAGSGANDLLLGVAYTQSFGSVGLHSNVLYSMTGDGTQATNLGDAMYFNAAVSYKISNALHGQHGGGHHSHLYWDGYLELNGEDRDATTVSGVVEENTGGVHVFLAPGIRISSSDGWGGFLSIGMPVIDNAKGDQANADTRLVAGFGMGF